MNIDQAIDDLRRLSLIELRLRFARFYGEAAPVTNNKIWLIKRIAWRLQALEEGDLSQRARQRADELARDADLRLLPPRPPRIEIPALPHVHRIAGLRLGSILTRRYKGKTLRIGVVPAGFDWEGTVYTSLSAVAQAITGSHTSGRLFFHLKGRKSPKGKKGKNAKGGKQ